MLFWLGPLLVFLAVGFLNLSVLNRGDWGQATGFGILGAGASCFVFMFFIPACAFSTEYTDVRWEHELNGPVRMIQDEDELIFTFNADGQEQILSDTSDDIKFLNQEDRVFRKVCQTTPAWAAPFNYGSCRYELTVNVS